MEDVARRAQVSRALVSLVFQDSPKVSAESRRKVLEAEAELGYRKNALAQSLASKHPRTIGVHIQDISNPYLAAVYAGVAEAAGKWGYDLLVGPGSGPDTREADLINTLLSHQVCGLILQSPYLPTDELATLLSGMPAVLIGRNAPIDQVDLVFTDEIQSAQLVVSHLVELGHTDIVHISGGSTACATAREEGFRRAMDEASLPARVVPGDFIEEAGTLAVRQLLTDRALPTAIFAVNDLVAVGAMGVLHEAGLRVPADVSIVGFDDTNIAKLGLVQLTTVRQNVDAFGQVAVQMLIDRVTSGRAERARMRMDGQLIVRKTTGPVPPRL
jgi:DNA-binding LacI/PurR family transcriptional regulator